MPESETKYTFTITSSSVSDLEVCEKVLNDIKSVCDEADDRLQRICTACKEQLCCDIYSICRWYKSSTLWSWVMGSGGVMGFGCLIATVLLVMAVRK